MVGRTSQFTSKYHNLLNLVGQGSARTSRLFLASILVILLQLSAAPAAAASVPVLAGYRHEPQYPSGVAGNKEVTSEKPESKLWWNDGYWWASMWSGGSNGSYHIFKLNEEIQTWEDTGTPLDPRIGSRADVLWDENENKLYVVSHLWNGDGGKSESPANSGRLYRYTYNTGTYTLDSGFPVNVNGASSETLVIDKDSKGQLWVTWTQNRDVMVNHSDGADHLTWGSGFKLPFAEATTANDGDDISSLISYGGHMGVMWSNQSGSDERMYFAVHEDGADPDEWDLVLAFDITGDDHINLKSVGSDDDGNIYAVIKGGSSSHLIVVLVCHWDAASFCSAANDWDYHVVYNSSTHNPTRPIGLIDTENRELYVFTRNHDQNQDDGIYYKVTDLDNISFNGSDIGIPFIKSVDQTNINDPTSTKQNLNSTTGLVVLASDSSARYYFHNTLDLDGSEQHILTVSKTGSGTVTRNPDKLVYDDGDVVELTAVADTGWQFKGWQGAATGTSNPVTVTMDSDKTVTALFEEVPVNHHTLDVLISPPGAGDVTLDPPGGSYEVGTTVTLTAEPGPSWGFTGWSGDATGDAATVEIVMDADRTVTANFAQISNYTLTVDVEGPGTVEVDPPGGIYVEGTGVTLTATPVGQWVFGGWSGDLTGASNPVMITMDSDKTITATFVWPDPDPPDYELTVQTFGAGSVTLDPPEGPYVHGDQVTLTAAPESGWSFSSWGGDVTGTENPTTVTMDVDKTVTATFVQAETGIEVQVGADPSTAAVGQEITYAYLVANIGQATLTDVTVEDDRLGVVTLDKTTLAAGETAVGQLTYVVGVDDLPGPLHNTATATATSVLDEQVSDTATVSVALKQLSYAVYTPLALGSSSPAATSPGDEWAQELIQIIPLQDAP